jgi:hypothetical protein
LGWKKRGENSAAVVSEKWCLKFLERFENAVFFTIKKRGKRVFGVFKTYFERLG